MTTLPGIIHSGELLQCIMERFTNPIRARALPQWLTDCRFWTVTRKGKFEYFPYTCSDCTWKKYCIFGRLPTSCTCLKAVEFVENPPKLSKRFTLSVENSSQPIRECYTTPLTCADGNWLSLKHSFLLSSCCPLNLLLGRDLMFSAGFISCLKSGGC